jgi:hypothetical protein
MKLDQLITIASSAYPDDLVSTAFQGERSLRGRNPQSHCGDTLAEFIAGELKDTFDEKAPDNQQLEEAVRALSVARRELDDVITALERKLT